MKFKILVKDKNDEWWEEYDINLNEDEVQRQAERIVESFNASLRPGESPRKLLKVEILTKKNTQHEWTKRMDGMSVKFRGITVDLMYCEKCRITGKRSGLNYIIKRDSKYKAKKYSDCSWIQ